MSPTLNEIEERRLLISPEHILVATDLEDQERLMPYIVAQARASAAFVTFVHAIEPGECQVKEGCPGCVRMNDAKAEAQEALEKMVDALEKAGVSCAFVIRIGIAVDVITDQIRISGATLLVMTSHGRGKLGQFLFGSVANILLGRAEIPLFIVGPRCKPYSFEGSRQILHPVSLHSGYEETAAFALALARKQGGSLTLLHVFDSRECTTVSSGLSWSESLLHELGWGLGTNEPIVSMAVAYGDVVEEVRRETEERNPTLIVMGVKEGTATWPLPDSTAYRILMGATCPVLVTRHRRISMRPVPAERALLVLQ